MDGALRALITAVGGFDLCVSEFVRVTNTLLPVKTFYRLCPELKSNAMTPAGTPLRVQLLGQCPETLADNARRAIELGSHGVDLNFGCPAKTVNRHCGGAALLDKPDLIHRIVSAVRAAVPLEVPVSAKMRLGVSNANNAIVNASAIESGGASSLVIHGRTRDQGYRPPVDWGHIGLVRRALTIPVIANGDINSQADFYRCVQLSGCTDIMLGRGAMMIPNLANVIRGTQPPLLWADAARLLLQYSADPSGQTRSNYYPARTKQWLKYLSKHYPQAEQTFNQAKRFRDLKEIRDAISHSC